MALPSSPPLLPEEYDLPSESSLLPLASGSSSAIGALNRKRQHSDYGNFSSDPLFSDTSTGDEEVHDAERPRRKKVVRGPWWSVGRSSSHDLRRKMAKKESFRIADSGVWMGSDGSEESIDSILSSQQRMQELVVEDMLAEQVEDAVPDVEAYAARIIQMCLDNSRETVDLSDLALNSISDATLRPLHQLIRQSFTQHLTHPPSEDEFTPLTPSIKLFLSTNQLTSLPTELFHLSTVTVLSVRNNHLTELSPAIARLHKLSELNIAGNQIRYLPWELLDLIHCRERHRQMNVRPNPLVDPTDLSGSSPLPRPNFTPAELEDLSRFADTRHTVEKLRQKHKEEGRLNMRGELELRLKLGRMLRIQYLQEASRGGTKLRLCAEELIYLASSAVRYFNVDGTPTRRVGPNLDGDDWSATLNPTANSPKPAGSTNAPSLFEFALRNLQARFDLTEFLPQSSSINSVASDHGLSPTVNAALRQAATNSATHGNETCSTCGNQYVIARAEWMEYWFNGYPSQQELSAETVLPFLRRACSWGCAKVTEPGTFRC